MSRFNIPFFPDVVYQSDMPLISNRLTQFEGVSFSRFGSGKSGSFHCFVDDWRLESIWRDPLFMIDRAIASGVCTCPDYSVFPGFPLYFMQYQVFRSRLIGSYWSACGVSVLPVLQWPSFDPVLLDFCFSGLSSVAVVAVRAPIKSVLSDWLSCAEYFRVLYPDIVVYHFGRRLGSSVWGDNCRVLSLNPV